MVVAGSAMVFWSVWLLLFLLIPIWIGIYVYRDAKRRRMNAALWTILCVLIPGFVGLILYLIVRGGHSNLFCAGCGEPVEKDFVNCPYCGAVLKERCRGCGYPLESDWLKCPGCGMDIPPEQRGRNYTNQPKDKGIGKILVMALLIPVVLCAILIVFMILMIAGGSSSGSSMGIMDMKVEELNTEDPGVYEWLASCEDAAEGIYVLSAEEESGDEVVSKFLIYRSDGYRFDYDELDMGGWFRGPTVTLHYIENEESELPYNLFYYETTNEKSVSLKIYTGGELDEYSLQETDSLYIDFPAEDVGAVSLYLEEGTDVYSVSCIWYSGEEQFAEELAEEEDWIEDHTFVFTYDNPGDDGITSFELIFYNQSDDVILRTELDMTEELEYEFLVSQNEDGELTVEPQ